MIVAKMSFGLRCGLSIGLILFLSLPGGLVEGSPLIGSPIQGLPLQGQDTDRIKKAATWEWPNTANFDSHLSSFLDQRQANAEDRAKVEKLWSTSKTLRALNSSIVYLIPAAWSNHAWRTWLVNCVLSIAPWLHPKIFLG